MKEINFGNPIVGVYYEFEGSWDEKLNLLDEYFSYVDEYYLQKEYPNQPQRKKVFFASRDLDIVKEAELMYPTFEVIVDPLKYDSWDKILLDLYLLSKSEFLVCSFGNTMCRLAYELMHSLYKDASDRIYSPDYLYQANGEAIYYKNLHFHQSDRENDFQAPPGTIIKLNAKQNLATGFFSVAENNSQVILAFKLEKIIMFKKFPTYGYVE